METQTTEVQSGRTGNRAMDSLWRSLELSDKLFQELTVGRLKTGGLEPENMAAQGTLSLMEAL